MVDNVADSARPNAAPPCQSQAGRRSVPLAESIEESQLLIWYVSREGAPKIEEEMIKTLVDAKANFGTERWDGAQETAFWNNYRRLAEAIAPVSVDSIKASYGVGDSQKTSARKAVRVYRYATIVVLVLLLICQMYWLVGNNVKSDIEKIRAEITASDDTWRNLRSQRQLLDIEVMRIQDLLAAKQEQVDAALPIEVSAGGGKVETPAKNIQGEIDTLFADHKKTMIELSKAELVLEGEDAKFERLSNVLRGNVELLNSWDIFTDLLLPKDERAVEEDFSREAVVRIELPLLAAKSALAIFNQYILPLLYGLLGSLAYILRTLTREIQEVTYTRGSDVRYTLRWPLGMLAGITVGWFFEPEALQGLAAITPLGLAFLAGYSVELLFAGLDRVVRAFTEPQGAAAGRPAKP